MDENIRLQLKSLKDEKDRLWDEERKLEHKRSELIEKSIIGKCFKTNAYKKEDGEMYQILSTGEFGWIEGLHVSKYGYYYDKRINYSEHDIEISEEEFKNFIKDRITQLDNMKVGNKI